jgi:hypothetical protein
MIRGRHLELFVEKVIKSCRMKTVGLDMVEIIKSFNESAKQLVKG